MRKILAIGALLTLSVCAIGLPEPDRPILETNEVSAEILASYKADFAYTLTLALDHAVAIDEIQNEFTPTLPGISPAEVTWYVPNSIPDLRADLDFDDVTAFHLPYPLELHRGIGDIVIEETKHKPRDRYRLPLWDYEPVAEPPALIS